VRLERYVQVDGDVTCETLVCRALNYMVFKISLGDCPRWSVYINSVP